MKIDSHQHFWIYEPLKQAWIDSSMQEIAKDFLPKDLKSLLDQTQIDGCVAVQADQSEDETQFLLDLAKKNPFIKGVVGWVDLKSNNLNERLEYFSKSLFSNQMIFSSFAKNEALSFLMMPTSSNAASTKQAFAISTLRYSTLL